MSEPEPLRVLLYPRHPKITLTEPPCQTCLPRLATFKQITKPSPLQKEALRLLDQL